MPKIYCIQLDSVWEDKQASFDRVHTLLQNITIEPGSLVVLPEMFATGFSMNVELTSKDEPEHTLTFLRLLAKNHDAYVMGGLVVQENFGKGKNQSVTVSPTGDVVCEYQKIQPITLAGESDAHEAGDQISVFQWNDFMVSPFICYDLRFPEWFRQAVVKRANVFVVIASWPQTRIQHWIKLLQARAIENQSYVVGVNRCGDDPVTYMPGRSMIINPMGGIVMDAGCEETVIHAGIHIEEVNQIRENLPFLLDMKL